MSKRANIVGLMVAVVAVAAVAVGGCGGSGALPTADRASAGEIQTVQAQDLWAAIFSDNPPQVFDVRPAAEYEAYHIPGSVSAPDGVGIAAAQTAQASGAIVIVAKTESQERAVAEALRQQGREVAILAGALDNWHLGLDINDATLKNWIDTGRDVELIDVRTPAEYEAERIPGCANKPIDQIDQWGPTLDPDREYVMICGSGMRSARARDTLAKQYGLAKVHNLLGGVGAWHYEKEGTACGG